MTSWVIESTHVILVNVLLWILKDGVKVCRQGYFFAGGIEPRALGQGNGFKILLSRCIVNIAVSEVNIRHLWHGSKRHDGQNCQEKLKGLLNGDTIKCWWWNS